MAGRKPEEAKPGGAPMWIVTFTDMSSLLLTFFIMLLTFSSMEDEKLKQATGSLSGAFGAMTPNRKRARTEVDRQLATEFRPSEKDGPSDPSMRKDMVENQLRKIQDREIFNMKLTKADVAEGTLIKVEPKGNEEHFVLGTDQVGDSTAMVLKEIAGMFKTLPVRLVIETHCDSEMPKSLFMTPLELTTLNGLAAAKALIDAGMTPERVGVSPRGDSSPVTEGKNAIDRFRNRRLDILVIPDGKDEAFGISGN